jgi:hypothetical protein
MDEDVTMFVQVSDTRDLREVLTMGISKSGQTLLFSTDEEKDGIVFKSEYTEVEPPSHGGVSMTHISKDLDGKVLRRLTYTFRLMTPVTPS